MKLIPPSKGMSQMGHPIFPKNFLVQIGTERYREEQLDMLRYNWIHLTETKYPRYYRISSGQRKEWEEG